MGRHVIYAIWLLWILWKKTVLRFLASVSHLRLMCYRITSLTVWMLCHCGSQPIGSSSITTRWKHSGVHHNAINTRSHPDPFASAAHLCNQLSSHYRQESRGGVYLDADATVRAHVTSTVWGVLPYHDIQHVSLSATSSPGVAASCTRNQ